MQNGHKHKNHAGRLVPKALRLVIAGGGTGGHLFPGIAIAQEFMQRNAENRVLFIGTGKSFEKQILSKMGYSHHKITVEGFKGRGILKQMHALFKIPRGLFQSVDILNRFKPHLILGVGSYAAGPVILGGWLLGIKSVLHEQNLLPGITNRLLAPIARRIYISFQDTQSKFNPQKVRNTGNPIRKEIINRADSTHAKTCDDSDHQFTVLIIGGSQGAHCINKTMIEALQHIKNPDNFLFIHQTGPADEHLVKEAYHHFGLTYAAKPFFDDIDCQYLKADLIIARAGATTVAETTALGKGVIFIPYPFAADNHQVLNALALAEKGAAEMIHQAELNGQILAERIEYYASHPEALQQLAIEAKRFGKPDASKTIVDDLYRLATKG